MKEGYIRAEHPCPEQPNYNSEIPDEQLPGCGDIVVLEYDNVPPVAEGDVFREKCPSCKHHNSRLEVVEVLTED